MLARQRNPLDELSSVAPRMALPHSGLNNRKPARRRPRPICGN